MNSKEDQKSEDQKSKTNWWGIIATGAVAVGGTLAFIQLSSEMNAVSAKLEKNTTKCNNDFTQAKYLLANVGDLVEIRRELYSHWTVYVGNGNVIHLVDYISRKAKVLCQKLEDVAEKNLCRVNNLERAANKRGLRAKSERDIKDTAFEMLDNVIDYDLLNNNCEHFSTYCRYGLKFSEQSLATNNTPIIRNVAPLIARSAPVSALNIVRAANYSSY